MPQTQDDPLAIPNLPKPGGQVIGDDQIIPPLPTAQAITPAQLIGSKPQHQFTGFEGKVGAVAGLANDFVQGWMAGKALKQQRAFQQGVATVQGSNTLWKQAAANWQNYLASNPDKNSVEYQHQAAAVNTAWQNYVQTMSHYSFPDAYDENGKPRKTKSKNQNAPELIAKSIVDQYGKMSGTQMAALGPAQQATAQAQYLQSQNALRQQQMGAQDLQAVQTIKNLAQQYGSDPSKYPDAAKKQYEAALAVESGPMTSAQQWEQQKAQDLMAFSQGKVPPAQLTPQWYEAHGLKAPTDKVTFEVVNGKRVKIVTDDNGQTVSTEVLGDASNGAVQEKPVYGYDANGHRVTVGWSEFDSQGRLLGTVGPNGRPVASAAPVTGGFNLSDQQQAAINAAAEGADRDLRTYSGAKQKQGMFDESNQFQYGDDLANALYYRDANGNISLRRPGAAVQQGQYGTGPSPVVKSDTGQPVYWGNVPPGQMPSVEQSWRDAFDKRLKQSRLFSPQQLNTIMGQPLYATKAGGGQAKAQAPGKIPPPPKERTITDQQVSAFMASPGGKGLSKQDARKYLEAASGGGQ